jgi:hypothetical protein
MITWQENLSEQSLPFYCDIPETAWLAPSAAKIHKSSVSTWHKLRFHENVAVRLFFFFLFFKMVRPRQNITTNTFTPRISANLFEYYFIFYLSFLKGGGSSRTKPAIICTSCSCFKCIPLGYRQPLSEKRKCSQWRYLGCLSHRHALAHFHRPPS